MFRSKFNSLKKRIRPKPVKKPQPSFFDHIYIEKLPSHQNAIDIIPSWNHAFPDEFGLKAGSGVLYWDKRIKWAISQFGDLTGKDILELGPLEASHTFMLDNEKPASIDAIEANKLAFLRCLVAKQIYGIKNATFYLGDFLEWLEETDKQYDLVVACGVLYHMADPVRLLELIARRTDAFFLWTHYFDEEAMPLSDKRRRAFRTKTQTRSSHGLDMTIHERSYHGAGAQKDFCGGPRDTHYWMERRDIMALIEALGFNSVKIENDSPNHPGGPAFSLYATRRNQC